MKRTLAICKSHDLEMRLLVAVGLQGIKLVYFVHLRIEEPSVGIGQTLYESRVRRVGIHFLYHQPFGLLALVLVRPFGLHLSFPFLFVTEVIGIASADFPQDAVDGFTDAVLPRSRTGHEATHQRGLVLHVVDVAEVRFPQISGQCREYRMRHRRPINPRCLAHQQLDEWRQTLVHERRSVQI